MLRILTVRRQEFRSEALEVAREECARRGLGTAKIEGFAAEDAEALRATLGFCPECFDATTGEAVYEAMSPFSLLHPFGVRLNDGGRPCATCGSTVAHRWLWVFVPVRRIASYRVRALREGLIVSRVVGRRLKELNRA
ncbi:MAG TPA: hypothetical protein VJ826_07395 [Candidatus Polarisedimenticolaceae bacterium]|nr:hypothetical protein [Candidatus Polarisedimenticolaceae bacterium]